MDGGTDDIGRGPVIPIGGAEDRVRSKTVLARVLELAGGERAHVAIIPTASRLRNTGDVYAEVFTALGAESVDVLPLMMRRDCENPETLARLRRATCIFLTGGNQLRLSTIVGGTSVSRTIRHRNARGAVVAGTSAGAAILCEHMIAFGSHGATPRAGMVSLAPGFGLVNSVIIDQHFRQRDRIGRLLAAMAYNPFEIGIGIDEDTAAIIEGRRITALGSNGLTVVDPSELQYSGMGYVRRGQVVSLIGLRLHILGDGDTFRLDTREAAPVHWDVSDFDPEELADADRDVRGDDDEAEDEDEAVFHRERRPEHHGGME